MFSAFIFFAQHGHEGGGEAQWFLDPHSGGLVFWTAIVFAIVTVVLYKAAWGPILDQLDKREQKIRGDIAAAEQNRLESQRMLEDYRHKLEGIKREAQAIIEEGNADKKRIIEEAHAKAAHEADETKQRALREIELAKSKAIDELRRSSIELALEVAEKVVGAELDDKKHRRIIDEAIAGYEKFGKN